MVNSFVQNFIAVRMQQGNSGNAPSSRVIKTEVKPFKAEGYLVDENILQASLSNMKSMAESGKFFYNAAVKGKGTDYTVGRINDTTTMLGSLGIASILSAGLSSRLGKGMEYVGFACWFAAMSLWPKIVGTPIKAFTGVDINQQYVNKNGERKVLFQDPQYICWDLIPPAKLEKIGDKLNIPKNIENRQEAIKNKIKQVATQGNTLTMITAGFATPIIASLMANYLRFPLADIMEEYRIQKVRLQTGSANIVIPTENTVRKYITNPIAKSCAYVNHNISKLFGKKSQPMQESMGSLIETLEQKIKDTNITDVERKAIVNLKKRVEVAIKAKSKFDRTYTTLLGDEELTKIAQTWFKVPEKVLNALHINGHVAQNIALSENSIERTNMMVDHLVKEFAGTQNLDALKKAIKTVAKHADNSAVVVDESAQMLGKYLTRIDKTHANITSHLVNLPESLYDDVLGFLQKIESTHSERQLKLNIKSGNTKTSFYQFINVLDEIMKHNESKSSVEGLKRNIATILRGNCIDAASNKLDAVGVSSNISNFIEKLKVVFKDDLSKATKAAIENKGCVDRVLENNKNMYETAKNIDSKEIKQVAEKLGKLGTDFVYSMAKEGSLYKTWLKRVGIAGAALLAVTAVVLTQVGKTNKFNPDVYKVKKGGLDVSQ